MKFLAAIIFLTAFAACISRTANANHTHENTMNEAAKTVPEPISTSTLTAANIANFWAKVDKRGPDDCWPWNGATDQHGYGQMRINKKTVRASHVGYRISFGEIATNSSADYHGTCVLHKCDNPACVNPAHLFIGTQKDNVRDMIAKNRIARGARHGSKTQPDSVLRGEERPKAKLTEGKVRAIRDDIKAGLSQKEIGLKFGIAQQTVCEINRGKIWSHVPTI